MLFRYIYLLCGLILIGLPMTAFAGGSVSFYENILPLLKDRPQLIKPILREVELEDSGSAVVIGGTICAELARTRVSPYVFQAREKGENGSEIQIIVKSNMNFYDRFGRIVFRIEDGVPQEFDEDICRTAYIQETFSSITIKY